MHTHWRIGSTSYVYRGDLLHNLRALAGEVEDVELILFDDGQGTSNLPSPGEVAEMATLLDDTGMSVTVHLPCDVGGILPAADTLSALDLNRRVIGSTLPLEPVAYVFHAHTQGNGTEDWLASVLDGIEAMTALVESPRQLALENLESYLPESLEPIFDRVDISRAFDIGHLWKQCRDPLPVMAHWLPSASVVHLHGVSEQEGRMIDHLSLACMEGNRGAQLDAAIQGLNGWQGVLTLEVFEEDYFTSRAALNRTLERISCESFDAD